MKRNDAGKTAATLADLPTQYRLAFARGYRDAADGLRFDLTYDADPADLQLAYEYGRLEAANVKSAGLPIEPDGGTREAALRIAATIGEANQRIGRAIPPASNREHEK